MNSIHLNAVNYPLRNCLKKKFMVFNQASLAEMTQIS